VRVAFAPNGVIEEDAWDSPECALPYAKLAFGDRWLLLTGDERNLIDKVCKHNKPLGASGWTKQIFQGLITSADDIFHLKRLGLGKYLCRPGEKGVAPYEVELEDDIMKPLVSGPDTKRYVEPDPETFLLFPYKNKKEVKLLGSAALRTTYPKAWRYLQSYEHKLRRREAKVDADGNFSKDGDGNIEKAPFNDDEWYRFGRHQNLDKQDISKLVVAQTAPELRLFLVGKKDKYLNNVRVNGIIPADGVSGWYLMGVLNGPVCNFVFRKIGKVKVGGFYEANKQFIAPLPVPLADDEARKQVEECAKKLQAAHTARKCVLDDIEKCMETVQLKARPESWLFPTLERRKSLADRAPKKLSNDEKAEWVSQKYDEALQGKYDEVGSRLESGATLDAAYEGGELSLSVGGVRVIDRIFVDGAEGMFILAQWKVLAQPFPVTEKTDGKKLCNALRRLAVTDNPAIVSQIIKLEKQLGALESDIANEEALLNGLVYRLYGLTDAEIELV
jgi:hypothetical protein